MNYILAHLIMAFFIYAILALKAGNISCRSEITVAEDIKSLWRKHFKPMLKYKQIIITLTILGSLIVISKEEDIGDIPLSIFYGFLEIVTFFSIIWFVLAGYIGYRFHTAIHCRVQGRWIEEQREKTPNTSFTVPYWPFWFTGLIPGFFVFFILFEPLFYVLYLFQTSN